MYINLENKDTDLLEPQFEAFVRSRLESHRQSDLERGLADENYSVPKMVLMAKKAFGRGCCGVLGQRCDHNLSLDCDSSDCVSFDRLDNDVGHRWKNLRVICASCNVRSKRHEVNY